MSYWIFFTSLFFILESFTCFNEALTQIFINFIMLLIMQTNLLKNIQRYSAYSRPRNSLYLSLIANWTPFDRISLSFPNSYVMLYSQRQSSHLWVLVQVSHLIRQLSWTYFRDPLHLQIYFSRTSERASSPEPQQIRHTFQLFSEESEFSPNSKSKLVLFSFKLATRDDFLIRWLSELYSTENYCVPSLL